MCAIEHTAVTQNMSKLLAIEQTFDAWDDDLLMAVFACGKSTVQPMGPTPRLTGAATGTQTGTSCLPTTRNLPVVINVRVGNVVAFFQTRPTPRAPGPQELRTDNFQRSTPKNVQRPC